MSLPLLHLHLPRALGGLRRVRKAYRYIHILTGGRQGGGLRKRTRDVNLPWPKPRLALSLSLSLPHCAIPLLEPPMAELYPSIAQCAVVATALKVLLFPA